ncbi:MAG: DNA-directed RNA polymerase subunit beta' [bacterium ADurb.Bin363]|nr:MAG: DNA-directed RNA polymerase subunit beta' [bacterium ADurb.Bin363]
MVESITKSEIKEVKIRSPLTCKLEKGVCQKCYGIDLSNHKEVLLGEAVGVIAAQSIGEPGTQLTMRTFHTGGVAEKAAVQTSIQADMKGKLEFQDIRVIDKKDTGEKIVVSQNGKIKIGNQEFEIPSGSVLRVQDGQKVEVGTVLVEFDPYHIPIISEAEGIVEYRELYVKEYPDIKYNVTERMAVKPMEQGDVNPRIVIFSDTEERQKLAEYNIPYGAYLMVEEGNKINVGGILAKILKQGEGTKDITGGLPRIQELFEARNPKGKAIVTEISGKVEILNKKKKGMRVVQIKSIENPDEVREYLIPFGEHLVVTDGILIKKGERLTDGIVSPHDILAIKGVVEAEQYILESVQQVYREQGVTISDKHIEIIVRQMFKKVKIEDGGSSLYLEDEVVDRNHIEIENQKLAEEKKKPGDEEKKGEHSKVKKKIIGKKKGKKIRKERNKGKNKD